MRSARRQVAEPILALVLFEVAPARPADTAALLVDPTTDDVGNNRMGPAIVRNPVETTGGPAALFLDARGRARRPRGPAAQRSLARKEVPTLLREPTAEGVKVDVRGERTRRAGLAIEEGLEGTGVGGEELLDLLADPSVGLSSQ